MKHLDPEQFLSWIESGAAELEAREHIQHCTACNAELSELRAIHQRLSLEETPDMPLSMAAQFATDLNRKIQLLPQRRSVWGFLQHMLLEHYVIMGVTATAVVVCALALLFHYDKLQSFPLWHGNQSTVASNPSDALNDSMAVADALATDANLQPTDFVRVSAESENTSSVDETLTTAFATDPFRSMDDLSPQEMQQLKKLLQADLKG
ncbi:MAG: hypothetical protein PHX83_08195 [Acidobacteriia bacterium]|nr:hypothetical protein [Terriglobia bacterium]